MGTKPAGNGRWGHADLVGNVAEWMLDGGDAYPVPCTDCFAPGGTFRQLRGGSYYKFPYRSADRVWKLGPFARNAEVGARCAYPM